MVQRVLNEKVEIPPDLTKGKVTYDPFSNKVDLVVIERCNADIAETGKAVIASYNRNFCTELILAVISACTFLVCLIYSLLTNKFTPFIIVILAVLSVNTVGSLIACFLNRRWAKKEAKWWEETRSITYNNLIHEMEETDAS